MNTTSTKHTPGPWNISRAGEDRLIYAESESAFDLAVVPCCGHSGETDANARLIAAAPELLASLSDIAATLADFPDAARGNSKAHYALMQARAAIAKATGTP